MSIIEEAREQAREALREDGFFNREQSTIVSALLDATEPPKPAEDEREALIATRKLVHEVLEQSRTLPLDVQSAQVMLVLLDAGYSKRPRPITDEMVAAADFAIMPYWGERYPSGSLTTDIARAALEAAEVARR